MRAFPCVAFLALVACTATSWSAIAPRAKKVIEPFDYRGVTLDDGSLRRQFDETRDYYLRIPNDDLLKGFRERAGKPAPGERLLGWYGNDTFHIFGQIVSGLSRMYAATGDPACREKVRVLIREWAKCIADDGYFYYSTKPNAPYYVYDKMVCGLLDAHLYCGNRDALRHLSRITDWAVMNMPAKDEPGFNPWQGGEWYTLSENLYRAYLVTGDAKYREFAKKWEHTVYWKHYAQETDIFADQDWYHAYSHVNTLSGAAAAYFVTGERWYLDAICNAYDYLQQNQIYATGGYGPDERLRTPSRLPDTLDTSVHHFETQCGSWAAFKLSKYLMTFTGDARYGDWIERLVINGIGATIPMSPDGRSFYYSGYNVSSASKRLTPAHWACCAGTRPQAIADYYDLVYFKDADHLYVNLFAPSTVKWETAGASVAVRQSTRFPESETVMLMVSIDRPATFGIKVRIPAWLSRPMTASINGRPVRVNADSLHWAEFTREWRDGDRLSLELPMGFSAERFPAGSDKAFPAAVLYGPVVMAFRTSMNPGSLVEFENLEECLCRNPGEPLTFHPASDANVLARPFYVYEAGERYYMYLDPSSKWTRHDCDEISFSRAWAEIADFKVSCEAGSRAELNFEGTSIRWIGYRFDDAGKVEVRVDGSVVAVVDQYGPKRSTPFRWEQKGLSPGRHTITLTILEDKNPDSKNRCVNIVGFDTMTE